MQIATTLDISKSRILLRNTVFSLEEQLPLVLENKKKPY